jgi:hypothetical protein
LRSILIAVFGFLALIGLGAFAGYNSGIGDRKAAQGSVITNQVAEQYQLALVDIQFNRYEVAKQRLEFIIANDPTFPGVQETLTQVLVLSSIPTATATATLVPTPDMSGAESAYQRSMQLIQAQDWPGALTALDQIRKLDSTYKTAQVDGMYYFALRNYGVALIGQGNLEGGIYQLTLAERFGTLDNTAYFERDNARAYLNAASFWELDWRAAAEGFAPLSGSGLWDGTMTATERYYYAAMRYGDYLYGQEEYCPALTWYQYAQAIGALDNEAAKNVNQAYLGCYPPTKVPTAPPEEITEPPVTEPPVTKPPATEPPATQPPTT